MVAGSIPAEFGNLRALTDLTVGGNRLTGKRVPYERHGTMGVQREGCKSTLSFLGNTRRCCNLENVLDIDEVQQHSEVFLRFYLEALSPEYQYTEKNTFSNAHCLFSGAVPPELGNLSNLVLLELYDNHLSGKRLDAWLPSPGGYSKPGKQDFRLNSGIDLSIEGPACLPSCCTIERHDPPLHFRAFARCPFLSVIHPDFSRQEVFLQNWET